MNAALARVLSLLGLVALGEGLFILFRIVPHESPWLGAALAAIGGLFLFLAPPPRIERVPRWILFAAGCAIAGGVVAYNTWTRASYVAPKVALIAFGIALAALAPFAGRTLPDRRRTPVATFVAWMVPVVGSPLATWGAQAAMDTSIGGTTPLELFLEHALLAPMGAILGLMGYAPVVTGQVITFATPSGPLSLNVGVACSGLQAMGLFAGVLLCFIAAEQPGARRVAIWSLVGLGGVYLTNVIRLVVLAVVGARWGIDALEWTHAQAGWLFFVAWTALFAWLTTTRTALQRPFI